MDDLTIMYIGCVVFCISFVSVFVTLIARYHKNME
jgi:hypothetical protein